MGFGPAAAVGVQIGDPERTVVALVGDGGMSAQLPALPMAVEQGVPVLFVVMNNRAHGTIELSKVTKRELDVRGAHRPAVAGNDWDERPPCKSDCSAAKSA